MGSSGKKKTTMAKLARENRLRERRLNKQAKKDARKHASSDHLDAPESALEAANAQSHEPGPTDRSAAGGAASTETDEAARGFRHPDAEPTDPRAKEVALSRLRDAPDEQLAVFEGKLRDGALEAGATELEMRDAQRDHPGHGV
jgi:hypothetical protein